MKLTNDQRERYQRQLILDKVGEDGQEKLMGSSVLVVGAGGLGSPVSYYLTAAGVGRIGIVDHDRVELSNLQRQLLHFTPDIGRDKVESAHAKLKALNPDVKINTFKMRISKENCSDLIKDYDLVIAAVDNLATRYLLNEICFTYNKPLVEAGVKDFSGHVASFIPPDGPCYQCLFPNREVLEKSGSWSSGLFGVLPGVIGSLEATEALKILLGIGKPLTGSLLLYDSLASEFKKINYEKVTGCPVCGKGISNLT